MTAGLAAEHDKTMNQTSGKARSTRRLKFEEAMQRLEQIVDAVEKGEIGIEESIDKYEEAMSLVNQCRAILQEAEQRIQKIQLDAQGELKVTPFEPDPGDAGGDEAK